MKECRGRSELGVVEGVSAWLRIGEWCLLAGLVGVFVAHGFVPGWRTMSSEFPNYYLAAELHHQGLPLERIYEWTWFQRQNDHLGVRDGLVSFAPNPPTLVLSLLPFTGLQPLAAKRAWMLLSLALLALSVWMLSKVTSLGWRRLILLCFLCVLPLSADFLFARHYVMILFLICAAYYACCLKNHWISGAIWSGAAALKLFPAFVVVLFVWKRNWRALTGFLVGAAFCVALSIFFFGIEVHRVFISEVLSQAARGDWLGPYALSQNSFITLWSHLFLIEPELNPSPLINSPALYAVALAITASALIICFLRSITGEKSAHAVALHWAALIPLLLLLSTTTAADYSCLLIFTAVVGFDALAAMGDNKGAFALLFLYVAACTPLPAIVSNRFPLSRLVGTTVLYILMLYRDVAGQKGLSGSRWLATGLISGVVLTLCNLQAVRDRAQDFGRRLPTPSKGYRFANPVFVADRVAFTEMESGKYTVATLANGTIREARLTGDALSVAGSARSTSLLSELSGQRSLIVRLPAERLESTPEIIAEGQEPSLSPNGKWLAFIREDRGKGTVWLRSTDSNEAPQDVLPSSFQPLDVTVTNDGDLIAAAGSLSYPHLLHVAHDTRAVTRLLAVRPPVRYPAISPDGKRLAFSRRDRGFWHLFVDVLATGDELQLTRASCNATSPSWADAHTLLYATDCGRGVGLSAIARVVVPN